jgi:hypothetical protein
MTRKAKIMMLRNTLLLTASASALILGGVTAGSAQINAMNTDGVTSDDRQRIRAETANLYASTLDNLLGVIQRDIAGDSGTAVIAALRSGNKAGLPSLSAEILDLTRELKISAIVIDADPTAEVDERIVVFVRDEDLRQNVTRSDIEREAKSNGYAAIVRLQNGQVVGERGFFDIPAGTPGGITSKGVGAFVGISGNDKTTSGGSGSAQVRVLACEAGFYGTGITEERDISRETNLGGDATDTFTGWTEVARNCSPEYSESVRFFDVCSGPDGALGTADDDASGQSLYEATQFIRQPSTAGADPFETEVFIDRTTAVPVDNAQCVPGDRISDAQNFLVEGQTDGDPELALKTSTSATDIGNGPGTVPQIVDESGAAPAPVSGIPFPADSAADYEFLRSCAAEYGAVGLPAGFTGPDFYSGDVEYFRDYNRRETYFSDNNREYILNYDIVTDPNPFGHASKGRGFINTTNGAAPAGDGWYKFTETCEREVERPEQQDRVRACSVVYPTHPNGQVNESRDGEGFYDQTTNDNPAANGPTQTRIDWDPWYETSNGCYYTTVTRTDETRNTRVSTGGQQCDQSQTRTRVVTTNFYQTGTSNSATTYDPNWVNTGSPVNCTTTTTGGGGAGDSGGPDSVDTDGDGIGNYNSQAEAVAATGTTGTSVAGPVGPGQNTGGGGGGGGGCFDPSTPVLMADGTSKPVCEIAIGDEISEGGIVLVLGTFLSNDMYQLDGVRVTATHVVQSDDGWVRVEDHPRAVQEISRQQKTCNLITSNNRMICNGTTFADQTEFGGVFLEDMMELGAEERIETLNMEFQRRVA